MRQEKCEARQYSDQMCCTRCGLNWDVNDPDPPGCRKSDEVAKTSDELRKRRTLIAKDAALSSIRKLLGMG